MAATKNDYRDAIGWAYLHLRQDWEARGELVMMTDPCGLVDALTDMFLGLAARCTDGRPEAYLDYMRANLDRMLPADMPEEAEE